MPLDYTSLKLYKLFEPEFLKCWNPRFSFVCLKTKSWRLNALCQSAEKSALYVKIICYILSPNKRYIII